MLCGLRVLVTGGAGYVGSHVALRLLEAGAEVVVLDDLSTGHPWAVLGAPLVVADVGDRKRLRALLQSGRFDALVHLAARIWVGESVRDPDGYYLANAARAFLLFGEAARAGVRCVVHSSTAAVYGEPADGPLDEEAPLLPINPYGASKMMAERALADIARAHGQRYAILRYFNVAGADPEARIGEATPNNTHLIKVALEAALGLRPELAIHGTDYPTPDGTCIRDYIHVEDLAAAHVLALRALAEGERRLVLNCGYGRGFSVREVVDMVERVTGRRLPVVEGPRRAGDPAVLVAACQRIRDRLGWRPRFDDLAVIVATAWRWEQRLQARFGRRRRTR